MKRFWKTVGIERRNDALAVTLDSRALKTPSGKTLLLPANKSMVATLIAAEWEHQETLLKPHALPLVRRAVMTLLQLTDPTSDVTCVTGGRRVGGTKDASGRASVSASLLGYRHDMVCPPAALLCAVLTPCGHSFYQDDPPPLVALQAKHWDPLLHWARTTFDVEIHTSNSLLLHTQPEKTKHKFDEVLSTFDHWEMAGAR